MQIYDVAGVMMKKYKMYADLCKKQAGLIMCSLMLLLAEAVLAVKMPFLMNHVLDQLFAVSADNVQSFVKSFLLYVVLFLIQIVIGYISSVMFKLLGIRNSRIISGQLMNRIYYAVKEEPAQFSTGNAMQIMGGDAFNIGEKGIIVIYQILHTAINLAAVFCYMWKTLSVLALLITIEFVIVMLVQKKLIAVINQKIHKSRELSGAYSYLVNRLITDYFNFRRIRCHDFFRQKYDSQTDALLKNNLSLEKTMYLNGLVNSMVVVLNFLLIFGLGSYHVIYSSLAISTLVTFHMYANQFGNMIINIPNIARSAKEFSASYDRVMRMYGIRCYDERTDQNVFPERIEQIRLENIRFSYRKNTPPVIDGFDMEMEKGNIYCISGSNGCGKSTLLGLITGEYTPDSGETEINGRMVHLPQYYAELCEHISFASSAGILFNDTVRNNLLLGRNSKAACMKKMENLYQLFGIDGCSELHPDAAINDTISNLSDGQKQKLSLMRTLLDDREIMIFDEPEKHLDAQTKQNFMDHLQTIKQDKIIIIVSHESDIQNKCDKNIQLQAIRLEANNENTETSVIFSERRTASHHHPQSNEWKHNQVRSYCV